MDERRRQRLSTDIQQVLEEVLARDVSDKRLRYVHLTRVKLSRDASHATLFYETTGSEEQREEAVEAMESASGFLRSRIASKVNMRSAPALSLVHDTSGEKGDRILGIIRELEED